MKENTKQQLLSKLAARIASDITSEYYLSRDTGCSDCSPLWLDDDIAIERLTAIILLQLEAAKQAKPS